MKLLDWFIKAKPDRQPSDEPVSPVYVMSNQPVRFLSTAAIMTAENAQRKSPQLYRITNFVSAAVQAVPWYAELEPMSEAAGGRDILGSRKTLRRTRLTKANDQANASTVDALNDLLKSPSDGYTAEQLRYWLTLNLMLYARVHFKVGVNNNGIPTGIYPLAAKHIKGIINKFGSVDKYEYGDGVEKVTYPSRRTAERRGGTEAYASEISFPSLSGMVEYNRTPAAIESIAYPIAIIYALIQRALDTASGHPNVKYIITTEKTLTKQQTDALTDHLKQSVPGEDSSGEVLFLYNTVIEVHTLDNKLDDIHSKIPLDDMTRQIAGVFGVPIALLGLGSADAAKYASNYGESRLSFWQDTVVPSYLAPLAAGLTASLCPPGIRIMFDLDAVPALWEGRAALGEKLSKVTFLTTNEKREILGFRPDNSLPPTIAPAQSTPFGADKSADEHMNGRLQ
jgi:phage portal protein BeeE